MTNREAAVVARGLGLRTRRGWVYRDVDLSADAGDVTAVLGPTGSGKTALLLTLSGRMRPTHGSVRVDGLEAATHMPAVRRRAGLGQVPGVNDLDDSLTAGQHAREAILFRGAAGDTPRSVLSRVGLDEHERTPVRDLDVEQRERLGIAMGLVGSPAVLLVDDIDHDLDILQQERLMELLRGVAADGVAVVAAAINRRTAELADRIVLLGGEDTAPLSSDVMEVVL